MVKDSKPGKGGAVRPPVIDLKASEVEDEKKTQPGASDASVESEKSRDEAKRPGAEKKVSSGGGNSEKASGKNGPSPKKSKKQDPETKDTAESKSGSNSAKKVKADTRKPSRKEERLPPQPRKGAKGALLVATVTALAAIGGGGYWLYENFGRDLLTASDRMESRMQEVAGKLSGAVEQTGGKREVA